MSWTIFKADIKANYFLWTTLSVVMTFYMYMIIIMFDPAGADAMNEMLAMFPEGMLNAFGFQDFGTTLLTFINSYIYGFLIFLFPMILSISINHKLVASYIDKGSMAYLISTPNSRVKIVTTQAVFSLASITLMFVVFVTFAILFCAIVHPGQLEYGKFITINIYALLMYYTISGIGFLGSCIANDSRQSLSIGIGVPVGFFILKMLGDVNDTFSWIGNLSLYALFAPEKVIAGEGIAYLGMALFFSIAMALYGISIYIFNKRDLHV